MPEFQSDLKTINRYINENIDNNPIHTPEFNTLLTAIITSCKQIAAAVRKCGIADLLGQAEVENASGDSVKKLDVLANDVMVKMLETSGVCSALVSEENENAIIVKNKNNSGRYLVCFDPLDGSGNIDCLVSIGTIFSIFELIENEAGEDGWKEQDCLLAGREIIAAGYVIYGTATILVLSTGLAPDIFMLDPVLGDFLLIESKVKIPNRGKFYSLNEGYTQFWDGPTTDYIQQCKYPPANPKKPMVCRYIGSLVADFHRTLKYGGIFMNPGHLNAKGELRLKLRYLYEVAPMAFLIEKAGGIATTGMDRMLEFVPTNIHQRVPICMGSPENLNDLLGIIAQYGKDHLQGTRFE